MFQEEFERFATQSGVFEALPWRSIAFSIFGLGALALYFSIPHWRHSQTSLSLHCKTFSRWTSPGNFLLR